MPAGGICNVCHKGEAGNRCHQCGKPVCDTCAVTDENGAFCSRTCSARYREYKDTKRPEAPRSGPGFLAKLIGLVIILAIAAFVLFKLGVIKKGDVDKLKQKGAEATKTLQQESKKVLEKTK